MNNLEWQVGAPGLIRIKGSTVCVRYNSETNTYAVEWMGKPVTGKTNYHTLDYAQREATQHLHDMRTMGYSG
jgi:hypothetical protein